MKTKHFFISTLFLISVIVLPKTFAADIPHTELKGHTDSVYSVAFSPNGEMLASKSFDETIKIWNPNTGQLLRTIHTSRGGQIAFSPDGNMLASGDTEDKVVNLWDPNTGELLKVLKGHPGNVSYVTFSPDGTMLASGCSEDTIRLWNPDTGQLLRILHPKKLDSITFSADGSIIANGGAGDANVKVWNPDTGEHLHTLEPVVDDVFDVAFSPEGHILASGRDFGVIKLWDTDSGLLLEDFKAHSNDVYDVAFSPDGHILASVGADNTVRLWEISTPDVLTVPDFPEGLTGPNVETWSEDFNAGNLDSWTSPEHQREKVTWQTIDGRLDVQTEPYCNGRLNISNDLAMVTNYTFDFTAFPIDAEQIRVKLKVHSKDNANAGIYIGKRPDSLFEQKFQHAYLFANHTLGNPDGWGHQGTPEIGLNLTEIDVVFDRGHFYVYSEGEYIVDFQANSIQSIDYVGIAVFTKNCNEEVSVTLDDFEISGPTIPATGTVTVDPIDKKPEDDEVLDDFWVEDFNDGHLDSWTESKHQMEEKRTTWQAKDGHLDVWIEPWQAKALIQTYELEFTGFPIKAEKLRVKVNVLEAQNANVGLFIGQYDQWKGTHRRTYKILHGSIWGAIEFPRQVPDVDYDNLKDIEIVFNKGHFELLSEGEHILEFEEPNLPYIDCLGIVAYTTEVPLAYFAMDNFIISDLVAPEEKSLNVRAEGKAAVLWGELKKQ